MKPFLFWIALSVSGAIVVGCQLSDPPATQSVSKAAQASPKSLPTAEAQVVSLNAYKVPYLGLNGTFYLNQDDKKNYSDPRSPKLVAASKMEKFSYYKDAAGKSAIARNCSYAYLGAAKDPKYYAEYKSAVWDLFELEESEKQDVNCKKFKYVAIAPPHGNPAHMHLRYGDEKSSLQAVLNISNEQEAWTPTYCGSGKTRCGRE